MSRAWTALAVALATALVAAPVLAQQRAPAEEDAAAAKKKSKPRLTLDLGAEEAYESNVPYTELLSQDDFSTRGTARLTAILPITRGQVELGAEGGANVYRTVKGLDHYTWGFLGAVEHRMTRRSELKLQGRSSHGYARDLANLNVASTLPPLTLMRSDSAEAGFRQRLGRAFDLRLEGRGESFRFDSPLQRDGWTAGGRLGFENAFSPGFALGIDAVYGRTASSPDATIPPGAAVVPGTTVALNPAYTIEVASAVATLRWRMTRALALEAEGGVARFGPVSDPVAGGADGSGGTSTPAPPAARPPYLVPTEPSTTPTLAANLSCTVGPHTLTAIASRRIEQTYGIGTIGVNRVLALEYRLALARWASFLLRGSNNQNVASDGFVLSKGRSASAGLDCSLPADFTARLSYAYWDRQDPDRDWRSHTVALGLSKRFSWR